MKPLRVGLGGFNIWAVGSYNNVWRKYRHEHSERIRFASTSTAKQMKMTPISWDKQDFFTAPGDMPAIRYAISDHDGVTVEMSMHDATIRSMVPAGFWLPVHATPVTNAKIERLDGRLVVLCGSNQPSDPTGNLLLFRVATVGGFSRERLAIVVEMILATLTRCGIHLDKDMTNVIHGN